MFCGGGCATDADCGRDKCEEVTDGSRQCVRRDSEGNADCSAAPPPDVGPGDPGSPTGPGMGGTTPECTNDAQCGDGRRCRNGACVDAASNPLGESCTGNDECVSGICAVDIDTQRSFCTQLCTTAQPCPGGFVCEDAGGGVSACKPMLAGVGASCTAPSDCLSGMCAESDGKHFCTRTRADDGECPSGFECAATADGSASLCVESEAPAAVETGGCSVGGNRTPPAIFFLSLLTLLVFRRRRASSLR
jgi:MYXO-CTERM domain-containing protein